MKRSNWLFLPCSAELAALNGFVNFGFDDLYDLYVKCLIFSSHSEFFVFFLQISSLYHYQMFSVSILPLMSLRYCLWSSLLYHRSLRVSICSSWNCFLVIDSRNSFFSNFFEGGFITGFYVFSERSSSSIGCLTLIKSSSFVGRQNLSTLRWWCRMRFASIIFRALRFYSLSNSALIQSNISPLYLMSSTAPQLMALMELPSFNLDFSIFRSFSRCSFGVFLLNLVIFDVVC